MGRRRVRRLVVGDTVWLRKRAGAPHAETVSLRREGTQLIVRIVFREGEDRFPYLFHIGAVATRSGPVLNVNTPGNVRRLLDAAAARGLIPEASAGTYELDGWPLYAQLVAEGVL
jgi:hypothetical protein